VGSFSLDKIFSLSGYHCRHPSIRTLRRAIVRSVQVGHAVTDNPA
jgi:hypothetical protein